MEGDCCWTTSWFRMGSAKPLICASRPLFWGYCTAWDAVILPPCTVIWTWTGPHRVSAESPVYVAGPELLDLDVAGALFFDDRGCDAEPGDPGCCTTGLPATRALLVLVR